MRAVMFTSLANCEDNMEDSGFDSDQKTNLNDLLSNEQNDKIVDCGIHKINERPVGSPTKKSPSFLQKKLERQIELARKNQQNQALLISQQLKKSSTNGLLPRNRLAIPNKGGETKPDEQPLVVWQSDSEDEFDLSSGTRSDITKQLIQDGYNLDLTPDDEDLDLIPPKPMNDRCICCQMNTTCCIQ